MNDICLINYSSQMAVDSRHSYDFWFNSEVARIICNEPFSRYDPVRIVEVDDSKKEIHIEKVTLETDDLRNIPVLMFLTNRILLNYNSEYDFDVDGNSEIVAIYEAVFDRNKSYAALIKVMGTSSTLKASDTVTKAQFEWIITDIG